MTFKQLITDADGVIDRGQFVRGAKGLATLTLVASLLFYLIWWMRDAMPWMTSLIAPIFGGLIFLVGCSLIYFWYCVLAKRLRGTGGGLWSVGGWLTALFLGLLALLLDYQNRTLDLGFEGLFAQVGTISVVMLVLAAALFVFSIVQALSRN